MPWVIHMLSSSLYGSLYNAALSLHILNNSYHLSRHQQLVFTYSVFVSVVLELVVVIVVDSLYIV